MLKLLQILTKRIIVGMQGAKEAVQVRSHGSPKTGELSRTAQHVR
jgi:hypothetical protein